MGFLWFALYDMIIFEVPTRLLNDVRVSKIESMYINKVFNLKNIIKNINFQKI